MGDAAEDGAEGEEGEGEEEDGFAAEEGGEGGLHRLEDGGGEEEGGSGPEGGDGAGVEGVRDYLCGMSVLEKGGALWVSLGWRNGFGGKFYG